MIDTQYAWFVYDKFYEELKRKEWKLDPQRKPDKRMVFRCRTKQKAMFNKPKRFKGNPTEMYFLLKWNSLYLEDEPPEEILEYEDEEDI